MTAWWMAPEWQDRKPMVYPDRTGSKQEVIVVRPERKAGDRTHKANERVRVYSSR